MESLSSLIPIGPEDESYHRGARRQATRYELHADIRVRAHFDEERTLPMGLEKDAEGVVLNASAGGLRVTVDRAVEVGEVVDVDVVFSDDNVRSERAVVVWVRAMKDGWLAGLRFGQR
ncbi:MAG: PilZ domain-containing protein [Sandaracinaceae bacterium]